MAVYLIRAGSDGPVKIGHARNPEGRMTMFQTAHYERLSLIRTWPGGQQQEAILHRAFSGSRIAGEWFRFHPSMVDANLTELAIAFPHRASAVAEIPKAGATEIQLLIKACGGPSKVAKLLGLSHSTVIKWVRIPVEHAQVIAPALKMPLHVLRPDVWAPPKKRAR